VVVLIIHKDRVCAVEGEGHPPVAVHRDGIVSAFDGVQDLSCTGRTPPAILILAESDVIPAWMPESSAMDGNVPVTQVIDL
jgi:hypothetical protein